MKHLYLLAVIFVLSQTICAQKNEMVLEGSSLNPLTNQYLGFSLYEKDIASKLDSIATSPDFTLDTLIERTDTSLFYFRGYWNQFNPFNIKMDSVKIIVSELKRKHPITKEIVDTVWFFQTEGSLVHPPSDTELRKAFRLIHKKLNSSFTMSQYGQDRKKKIVSSEWYRYYTSNNIQWSANITWKKRNENWTTFTITFITKLKKLHAS